MLLLAVQMMGSYSSRYFIIGPKASGRVPVDVVTDSGDEPETKVIYQYENKHFKYRRITIIINLL